MKKKDDEIVKVSYDKMKSLGFESKKAFMHHYRKFNVKYSGKDRMFYVQ